MGRAAFVRVLKEAVRGFTSAVQKKELFDQEKRDSAKITRTEADVKSFPLPD
jgi:hypothetical protein